MTAVTFRLYTLSGISRAPAPLRRWHPCGHSVNHPNPPESAVLGSAEGALDRFGMHRGRRG